MDVQPDFMPLTLQLAVDPCVHPDVGRDDHEGGKHSRIREHFTEAADGSLSQPRIVDASLRGLAVDLDVEMDLGQDDYL